MERERNITKDEPRNEPAAPLPSATPRRRDHAGRMLQAQRAQRNARLALRIARSELPQAAAPKSHDPEVLAALSQRGRGTPPPAEERERVEASREVDLRRARVHT